MTLTRCPACGRHAMADAVECPSCGASLPDDDRLYEAFVGRRWDSHYRDRLTRFHREEGGKVSWNWAAFFVPGWFLYRKLYDYWIGFLLLFFVLWIAQAAAVLAEMAAVTLVALACTYLGVPILQGMFGDYLLYRRARKVIAHARARVTEARDLRSTVLQRGGTNLAVVLLLLLPLGIIWIGIVAAVSIPKFAETKELAYRTAMKSDLRNLVLAQRSFLLSHEEYAGTVEQFSDIFQTTTGVTITIARTDYGWVGTATHRSTAARCQVYVGMRPDDLVGSFVTEPGVPACDHAQEGVSETPGPQD
jgi:hypothetical protein